MRKSCDIGCDLGVLLVFVILSILMTYPIVLKMWKNYMVAEFQDDLITMWTLAWDIHKISHLSFSHFFDANIFYPYRLTLAFSEHMLFISVMALPIYILLHNMVVVYGILDISAFALSGFTMFLFVKFLTRSYLAGIVAGIIFTFFPYRFFRVSQLQTLMVMWIPLLFLYLHKFYGSFNYRYMVYAAIFYVFTSLSNGYYMLFLLPFIVVFVLFYGINEKSLLSRKHIFGLLIFVIIDLLFIFPVYYPYLELHNLYGVKRSLSEVDWFSASFGSYYSTCSWYGRIKSLHFLGDRPMFIGFLPMGLLVYLFVKSRGSIVRNKNILFYTIFTLLAVLLSFGPYINHWNKLPGVYLLLYKYFPGFYGLREPSRFASLFAFGIAVLVGYAVKRLDKSIRWRKILWLIPIIIIFEYASFPLSMVRLPYDKKDLHVISWLSKQKGNFAIFELPYNINEMTFYMYYSTYHWKRIVSSFNGFLPPIQQLLGVSSMERKLSVLRATNVSYIVVYKMWYPKSGIKKLLEIGSGSLKKVYEDEKSIVYEITDRDRSFIPYSTKLSSHRFSVYIPRKLPPKGNSVVVLKLLDRKPVVFLDKKKVVLVWRSKTGGSVYREIVSIDAQRLAFLEPRGYIVGRFKVPDLPLGCYLVEVRSVDNNFIGKSNVDITQHVDYWGCQPLPPDGYGVKFIDADFPEVFLHGKTTKVSVTLENMSKYDWITYADNRWQRLNYRMAVNIPTLYNIHLSYHWLDAKTGKVVVFDGNRAVLPCVVRSGEVVRVPLMIKAPGE